jgi:hypothetical protein
MVLVTVLFKDVFKIDLVPYYLSCKHKILIKLHLSRTQKTQHWAKSHLAVELDTQ